MSRKRRSRATDPVRELVIDVLATISRPHTCDIIQDVFLAIERNARWRSRYQRLRRDFGKPVLNQWIGRYVSRESNRKKVGTAPAVMSRLIKTYSLLR